jgi:large subunit ribosomal protein L6e
VSGLDKKIIEKVSKSEYFSKDKAAKKTGEEAFFKQGEKPEVSFSLSRLEERTQLTRTQKKELAAGRADDQKSVDKSIIAAIKKEPLLASYLKSSFSLRKGDKPHEMIF